jgi:hypothetical protein
MYTLYDSKTESYIPPFYAKANGDAIRQVSQVVNDPSSKQDFAKYPEDFTLFQIGAFDDAQGMVMPNSANENLGCLVNFKKSDTEMN